MLSLHQLRCFLTVYEKGSLTAAAEELGYSQPSISEQVRNLERTLGAQLFARVGRGVVPTSAAEALRPHAERTVSAAEEARQAVQSVSALETGTIRFGMFGIARIYFGAQLIADVLERHPGVRVELVGQNSIEVQEDLRRGRLEAAMISVPAVTAEGLHITPVASDELVYVSTQPERLEHPVTPQRLAAAPLVMSDTTWRATDTTRMRLRRMLHEAGLNPRTRIEVEDVETALQVVGMGLADTVVHQGVAEQLVPRLAPGAGWVSLRPRMAETLAIVRRAGAPVSPATQLMIELATKRMQEVGEPVKRPRARTT